MPWPVILGIIVVWSVIYFFNLLLQTCHNYPYIWLINRTGIRIRFGYARWRMTAFNRSLQRFGTWKPRFFQRWFGLGAVCGILLILPAVALLLTTAVSHLLQNSIPSEQILAPALPGVNLPFNEVVYYLATLLLCSILHELGHSMAAAREDVRIVGCGLLVLGVIPAAFVDLSNDQLRQLTPWQQLRIFCAGVWHNVILVFLAGAVFLFLPVIASLGYYNGIGVIVTQVNENTPIAGQAGLAVGDHILGVGDCTVSDSNMWYKCLANAQPPSGFCTDIHLVDSFDEALQEFNKDVEYVECCPANSEHGVCFRQMELSNNPSYVCMPARQVIVQSSGLCNTSTDCPSSRYTCLVPSVDSSTKLLQVHRKDKEDMLFLGQPGDLYYGATVSNYIPKWSHLPLKLPFMVETFCRYLISFSGALALLNVVPCIGLDGHWITSSALEFFFSNLIPKHRTRNILLLVLLFIGTSLLILNVVMGIWTML